jgi:hypothetical protein
LYSSTDIIRHIKSRRMRRAGNVALMEEGRNVYRGSVGMPEGKDYLEDQGVDGRFSDGIKMDLRETCWGMWRGFTWLRIGTVACLL